MGQHESADRRDSDPEPRPASKRRRWAIAIALVVTIVFLSVAAIGAIGNSPVDQTTNVAEAAGPGSSISTTSTTTALTTAPAPTATTLEPDSTSTTVPPTGSERVFAATSPFNAPITPDPVLDSESSKIAAFLGQEVVADLYEFGIAIYEVNGSTTPVGVDCTEEWGTCLLEDGLHRIPANAQPAPGVDGTLVIIDWSERRTVEMWQAVQLSEALWSAGWGTTTPIDGTGIPAVFGNGSGVSHLAGVIRVGEIAQGRIDHALAFSTNNACRDDYRSPATKTDGQSARGDCVPEGARIQLDPSIDLDRYRLTPAERTIAETLQTYGAYAIDIGGSPVAIYFEIASDATSTDPGSVYTEAGLSNDYEALRGIPWEHLRVLNSWDGA